MLDKNDCQKINSFLNEILYGYFPDNGHLDFQRNILVILKSLFKFNKSSFFISENYNLSDPGSIINNASLNLKENMLKEYYDYFYKIDIASPLTYTPEQKLRLQNKPVTALTDIMSFEEYETTEFYLKFMKKYNLYYFMIMRFVISNKQIGFLGIYRSKDEGPFTEKDREICAEIKKPITLSLYNHLKINELLYERQSFVNYTHNFPLGLVVLDKNYNYVRSNSTAEQYFSNIGTKEIKFFKEYFTSKILPKIHIKLYNQGTNQNAPLSVTVDNYIFKVVQFDMPIRSGLERFYNVYIMWTPTLDESKAETLMTTNHLSPREKKITELIAKGYNNEKIAKELYLSVHTVKTHIQHIYKKLGVSNRTALLFKIKDSSPN